MSCPLPFPARPWARAAQVGEPLPRNPVPPRPLLPHVAGEGLCTLSNTHQDPGLGSCLGLVSTEEVDRRGEAAAMKTAPSVGGHRLVLPACCSGPSIRVSGSPSSPAPPGPLCVTPLRHGALTPSPARGANLSKARVRLVAGSQLSA